MPPPGTVGLVSVSSVCGGGSGSGGGGGGDDCDVESFAVALVAVDVVVVVIVVVVDVSGVFVALCVSRLRSSSEGTTGTRTGGDQHHQPSRFVRVLTRCGQPETL